MIGQQCPGITADTGFGKERGEAIEKELPVMIIVEDVAALDTANDNMLKKAGDVKSG
jgi:hypothetical protein